jgi:hypothetical protein
MKTRIIAFVLVVIVGEFVLGLLSQTADPQSRTARSLAAVNGGSAELTALRAYEAARISARGWAVIAYLLIFAALFGTAIHNAIKRQSNSK